jgi:hypothetical protein
MLSQTLKNILHVKYFPSVNYFTQNKWALSGSFKAHPFLIESLNHKIISKSKSGSEKVFFLKYIDLGIEKNFSKTLLEKISINRI